MKIILFLFVSTLIFITSPSLDAESQTFQNMEEYEFYINEEYQTVQKKVGSVPLRRGVGVSRERYG